MTDSFDNLVEELSLGSARGGRRIAAQQVIVNPVRGLSEADIPQLSQPPVVGSQPNIPELKHQHHRIAALLAKGTPNQEISLITGFSPSYISILKNSPDMKELVQYYAEQVEERTVDAMARLRTLGITAVEELQRRLNDEPEKFTATAIMDMIEIGLVKPMSAAAVAASAFGAGRSPGAGLQINLNFKAPEKSLADGPAPLIEAEVK